MALYPQILDKTSGRNCLTQAYHFLTEKQKRHVENTLDDCKESMRKIKAKSSSKLSSSAKKSKLALKRLDSRADSATQQLGRDLEASLKARYDDFSFPEPQEVQLFVDDDHDNNSACGSPVASQTSSD